MKSNLPQDGHFPYGDQPDYREFLMPKELEAQFLQLNEQNQHTANPLIIAKYFNPMGAQTWYMTEYDPATEVFYGFVTGMPFPEWGSISLRDFIGLELPLGLKIERDLHFPFQPLFSDVVSEEDKRSF